MTTKTVKCYAINQATGEETLQGSGYLDDFLPRDDDEYYTASEALKNQGRYWVGGGASQLFLLMAA